MADDFLSDLKRLSYNLWWVWNRDARRLFKSIRLALWRECRGNPVPFVKKLKENDIKEAYSREEIATLHRKVLGDFDSYMKAERTWFSENNAGRIGRSPLLIAYFSPEFGVNEALPIYSGGLGILAGDHLKSASDLGLPLIGMGILYKQGYFIQHIDSHGNQQSSYENHAFDDMPVAPVKTKKGEDLIIGVEFLDRVVFVKVWKAEVGRITLFLLDSDITENRIEDRQLTYKLYGGGEEMRIIQEMLLGIGGARAINEMNIEPTVWHMNEGHSVFLGLERITRLMQENGLTFYEAMEAVKANTLFTTHTPVPAGNDAFSIFMMDRYLRPYLRKIGIAPHEFLNLGLRVMASGSDLFSLTVLGIHLSSATNAVSRLHGQTTRRLWSDLWRGLPLDNIPIYHITNGIHITTWLAPEMEGFFNKYLKEGWKEEIDNEETWKGIYDIPDREMWEARNILRKEMIAKISVRAVTPSSLNPDMLTICFARRFATYKRANLIFRDMDRLKNIIGNKDRPVQIIISGKAHPADRPAQERIRQIYEIARRPEFAGRIVLLEEYDMFIARYLIRGADIWLNTPRRPLEACGTSGQKAAINGALNLSVLDGWWVEGFNSDRGWAIGDDKNYSSEDEQDDQDAKQLYRILEEEVIPMYYERGVDGIPVKWVRMVKNSVSGIAPIFNSHRMVKGYLDSFYAPSSDRRRELSKKDYAKVKELAEWKLTVRKSWEYIKIVNITTRKEEEAGEPLMELIVTVDLGPLSPSDVSVEACRGKLDCGHESYCELCTPMILQGEIWEGFYTYATRIKMEENLKGFSFMVVPFDPLIGNKYEMGLIKSRYIEF